MIAEKKLPDKIIYLKTGGVKNVSNATQYQRALLLSEHFDLAIVTDGEIPEEILEKTADCYRVRSGWVFVLSSIRILRALSREGFRVLYSSNQPRAVIVSYLASLMFSFRWVVDLWDDPMLAFRNMRKGRFLTSLYRRFLWRSLPRADAWVLGLHEDMLSELPARSEGLSLLKITNGTIPSLNYRKEKCNAECSVQGEELLRVGHAGWVTLQRGVELVLAFLKSLQDEEHRFQFRAWGPAEDEALEAIEAHNAHYRHKLKYLGKVSHRESLSKVAESDVCLCLLDPSVVNFRYSYPIKLFEYMAAGKVVIATDTPAIREVIEDGKSGILIDNTVDSFRKALETVTLMKDRGDLITMEEAARNRVKSFEWEVINEHIVQFLSSEVGLDRKKEAMDG